MRWLIKILIILPLLLLMSGCENKNVSEPLRIATNDWPGYETLHLAAVKDYYETPVKMVEMGSASEVMRAYKNEVTELAALTLDEVLLLQSEGFDPVVILILDISNGGDAIIANESITSFKELEGKRIGLEDTALGAYVVSRALEMNTIDYKDIETVSLEFSEHQDAFKQAKVDAVVTFEPVKSILLQEGGHVLFSSKEIPGEIVDVLVAPRSVLQSRHDEIAEVIKGWNRASEYLKHNSLDAAKDISEKNKLAPELFLASLEGLTLPTLEENSKLFNETLLGTIEKLQEVMLRQKLLKKKIETEGLLDDSFVNIGNQ